MSQQISYKTEKPSKLIQSRFTGEFSDEDAMATFPVAESRFVLCLGNSEKIENIVVSVANTVEVDTSD